MTVHDAIPQPSSTWPLGNLLDLDEKKGVFSLVELAQKYGPVYRLELPGNDDIVVVTSQQLVDELCDETRFEKKLHPALREVRGFAGDGLFTAETSEANWGAAHRILMPAFGPAALRRMFDGMVDISEQVMLKWERQGPGHRIDVGDNTTRLTLDTIALCSFGYRFNSMYSEAMHPYVGAMVRALLESDARSGRLPLQNRLMLRSRYQYEEDRRLMHQVADQIIDERRRNPSPEGSRDILDVMLTATDPETGEHLSDENVRYQMVTFLIAGHETTSGLLTFVLYELMRHPDVLARAQAEVDEVCGTETPRFEHLARLTYLDQVQKETLRLWPTAPAFAVTPLAEETVLGGRYRIGRGETVLVVTPQLHRDRAVWGADAEDFRPERFVFEQARQLPPNAWKPFGNGRRSCIGRGFALQEATLFLAMTLQRFDITPADPDYRLDITHTLTMKPGGLFVHARRRKTVLTTGSAAPRRSRSTGTGPTAQNGVPIRVLYGSEAGTSEAFAQQIATDATLRGYTATLDTLDSAAGTLTAGGAVVIVSSSYEGRPPQNARAFVSWLDDLPPGALTGVRYAVFGNGNTDWARTYQAVPAAIDAQLARAGATALVARGAGDAGGDLFGDFDAWYDTFWEPVSAAFGQHADGPAPTPAIEVEFVGAAREPLLRHNGLELGTVVANRELVDTSVSGARSKRHIEVALPAGSAYRTGDHLAVLATNPGAVVDRVLSRFGLAYDTLTVIRIGERGRTFLPTGTPVAVGELLTSYVELSQPATRKHVEQLSSTTACPPEEQALRALAGSAYADEVLERRVTVLDLLERHCGCQLPFSSFLQMLGPLTPRQYSISSSPRWSEDHATLTVAVLTAPAMSGSGVHEGVASTHLARTRPGTKVAVHVRPSTVAFHPPQSLDTPIVMVCAGSGLAPFRGFLQERAIRAQEERTRPAPALLFFGCTDPAVDYLYHEELDGWAEQGIVDLRPAFSRLPDGPRFVQDRLWADRRDVVDLVDRGATFYVCGDGKRMAPAVFDTCTRMYQEATGESAGAAQAWLAGMQLDHGRYLTDIFS